MTIDDMLNLDYLQGLRQEYIDYVVSDDEDEIPF